MIILYLKNASKHMKCKAYLFETKPPGETFDLAAKKTQFEKSHHKSYVATSNPMNCSKYVHHYHLTNKKSKFTKGSIKTIQLGLSVFGEFVGWKKTQSDRLQDETEVWKRMCPEVRCAVAVIHSKLLDGSVENGSKTTVPHFSRTNILLAPGKMVLAFKIPSLKLT